MAEAVGKTLELRYGSANQLPLTFGSANEVAVCDLPRGELLIDVKSAAMAAVRAPLGFPSLAECTVPGDRITLAIDPDLPRAATLVAAIVETLLSGRAEASSITLLLAQKPGTGPADPTSELPAGVRSQVKVVIHDPQDTASRMYVAATDDARPFYLNRALAEADFAVTLGVLRPAAAFGYYGISGGMVTTFSDAATQTHFHTLGGPRLGADRKTKQREAERCGWLFGGRFTVQVVPGKGDSVLHVLGGDLDRVAEQGEELAAQAWQYVITRPYEAVLAAIAGQREATWRDVANALACASRAVAENGSIVLCANLTEPPDELLRRIGRAESDQATDKLLRNDHSPSALVAAVIRRARRRARLYLLSPLTADQAESAGITALEKPAELAHLVHAAESTLIIQQAQSAHLVRDAAMRGDAEAEV